MAQKNGQLRYSDKTNKKDNDLSGDITKLAYEFYTDRGCRPGRELDDWLRAERIVLARRRIG